ncbi:MAG: M35 family metallopeptidase, partial [Gammaproteobacteria bacterium]|nr:M35 family metallopeptidase [Gammaproteobacteria bacterium]
FEYGAQERATTIIHEMVHATAASQWGHPGGNSFDAGDCRSRASRSPRKARSNAYNFERLFMAFDPGA